MAQIRNPKKAFNFGIIAAGLNPYTVQTATIPDFEIEIVEHGDTNHRVKTAGQATYGNVTLTKLKPIDQGDNWVWSWYQGIQNVYTGGGQLAQFYKRDIDIVQYSYDNVTVTDRWELSGAWPTRITGMDLDRTASNNSMETVELAIDSAIKTR